MSPYHGKVRTSANEPSIYSSLVCLKFRGHSCGKRKTYGTLVSLKFHEHFYWKRRGCSKRGTKEAALFCA